MQSRIYCFDRYIIDPTRREFWDGDKQLSLELKVFDTLIYLLEHRDRTVCRDELISAVWGRVDITDSNLNQVITHARHAVGDNAKKQHVIRTIPRHGYGWVLPVEESHVDLTLNGNGAGQVTRANGHSHPAGTSSGIRVQSAVTPPRWRNTVRWLAPALAVTLIVSAVAFWPENGEEEAQSVPTFDQTALVLPVTVVGDRNESWIRLGVMDLIADRLREAGQAVVPSDNTVALAREITNNGEPEPEEIAHLARIAAAGMVVQPTAERINGHWRVTLQTVHGLEHPLVADGEGSDVITAAHAAADRVTLMLGYPMPVGISSAEPALDRLLQQVRTAMLSDRFDEARALLDGAEDEYRSHPRLRLQSVAIDVQAGRRQEAEAAYRALLHDVPPADNPLLHAQALNGLGLTLQRRLDYPAAEAAYTEAAQILETLNGYEALNILGQVFLRRSLVREIHGNFRDAQADSARARMAFESTGDQLAVAKLDGNLAILLTRQARYAEAIPHAERALERVRAFGDVQSELRLRAILAVIKSSLLDAPGALAEVKQFDDLLAQIENPHLEESVNSYRMGILFSNGHLQAAGELLRKALSHDSSMDAEDKKVWMKPPEATAAHQALARQDAESAARFAETALQRTWDQAMTGTKARVWLTLFRAHMQMEQFEAAAEAVAAALAWAETESDPLVKLNMTLLRAEYASAFGEIDAAKINFEDALEQAEALAIPIELLRVTEPYVAWLIAQGDMDHAGVIAGGVAGWTTTNYSAALLQLRLYHALGNATAWRQAVARAQSLAGERQVPPELLTPPRPQPWVPESGEPPETALAATSAPEDLNRP